MFRTIIQIVAALGALALLAGPIATPAAADDIRAGALQISAVWARATPKGASIGGGYFKITNTGNTPDRLIGGTSPVSEKFEIHEMSMDNGVMKMRPVTAGIEIKPGQTVELKPGGFHVMLVGLKQQLAQGQHFKATLIFEKAGKVDVDFAIVGIGAMNADGGSTQGSHGGMSGMPSMPGMGDTKMK
jgi:copper(I)-binding protein